MTGGAHVYNGAVITRAKQPARRLGVALAETLFGLLLVGGCSTTEAVAGGAACTYGQVIRCTTDAGCEGFQQCAPDLSTWGPCTCGTDAGTAPDGDGG